MRNFKYVAFTTAMVMMLALFAGCSADSDTPSLNPSEPVTVTVWHYHTGALLNAFDAMVLEFNETIGMERGIIVSSLSFGNMGELESAVRASAHEEAGSMELPNIFASFPDTAYVAQELGLLIDLDDYLTEEQLGEYFTPFIERGRMGNDGELRIFPVAKSAEIMLLNETHWLPFAQAHGFTYNDLRTMEGIAHVAQVYYHYTGGLAFWGRDAMANLFVIGSKMFGTEIFEVENGTAAININEEAMRRIWDYYYTPFISGYFAAFGRFRSDDVRVGDLLAFVGSTASAAFFPPDIRVDGETHQIQARALPAPLFEGANNVMIQQGAGMVVTTSTPEKQYASLIFLRWFTEPVQNLRFSALSGRIPVRLEAMDADLVRASAEEAGLPLTDVTYQTLVVALEELNNSYIYATCAFTGGVEARAILTRTIREKASADREAVLEMVANSTTREEAIAYHASYERFRAWVDGLRTELEAAVS